MPVSAVKQLLEEIYERGMQLPEIGPDLRAGEGMLFAWHPSPIAPWQDERWLAEMRRICGPSAYTRIIENQFVSAERSSSTWPRRKCVRPELTPARGDRQLHIWVGVDASTKRNSTALVALHLRQGGQECSPRCTSHVHADANQTDRLRDHGGENAARLERALSLAQSPD